MSEHGRYWAIFHIGILGLAAFVGFKAESFAIAVLVWLFSLLIVGLIEAFIKAPVAMLLALFLGISFFGDDDDC